MTKRFFSMILAFCISFNAIPLSIYAQQGENDKKTEIQMELSDEDNGSSINDAAAVAEGSARTVNDVIAQLKFSRNTGHRYNIR